MNLHTRRARGNKLLKAMADPDLVDRVAWAINQKWNEIGEVPFPLYQHEAEELAKAAIDAVKAKT